jgi:hypothetical protein
MTTHPKRECTQNEIAALVVALRNTPNWHRETFGDWKDMTYVGDNSPFKAADMLECLASQLAAQKREGVTRCKYLVESIANGCVYDSSDTKAEAEIFLIEANALGVHGPYRVTEWFSSQDREVSP